MTSASQPLLPEGIIPPLVTPLSRRDELDREGLERLINHVIAGGVSGVFILGTTGEAPSLSYRLRREMIEESVRLVAGRVPVLVGITDTAFVESIALAEFAADAGATAAVLTTPYYFPAGQTELTSYVVNITPHIPLPLVLYNMPSMTKIWFEMDTLRKLSELDNIAGVKDSGGDLDYFAQVCKLKELRPDWRTWIGPEALLEDALNLGGDGGVAGGSNVIPDQFVGWFRAVKNGDEEAAKQFRSVVEGFQDIYEIGKYTSRFIKGTKSALSLIGICSDLPADPFHPFLAPERARVAEVLKRIGLENLHG